MVCVGAAGVCGGSWGVWGQLGCVGAAGVCGCVGCVGAAGVCGCVGCVGAAGVCGGSWGVSLIYVHTMKSYNNCRCATHFSMHVLHNHTAGKDTPHPCPSLYLPLVCCILVQLN